MTFGTCQNPRAHVTCAPMESGIRKVSWRRRQALFLLELACMVGLCGLGYLNMAIALAVLTIVSMLHKDVQFAPQAIPPTRR